jgi:Condensation domain
MGVMARGRKEKINLSLQDILQCKSINDLALRVGSAEQAPQQKEKVDELFDLSPIQQMYFQSATSHQGRARFNQSFSLRITRKIQTQELMRAIEFIIDQHSMLRARFSKNKLGVWQQRISKVSVPFLYHIRVRLQVLTPVAGNCFVV